MTQLVVLIPGVALTRAAANALAVVPAGSAAPIRTAVLLLAE